MLFAHTTHRHPNLVSKATAFRILCICQECPWSEKRCELCTKAGTHFWLATKQTKSTLMCTPAPRLKSPVSSALLQGSAHGTRDNEGNGNARSDNRKTYGSPSARQTSHQKGQSATAADLLARRGRVDDAGEQSRQHFATHIGACTSTVICSSVIFRPHSRHSVGGFLLTGFAESARPSLHTHKQHRQGYSLIGHHPQLNHWVHRARPCPERALSCRRYTIRHRIVAAT